MHVQRPAMRISESRELPKVPASFAALASVVSAAYTSVRRTRTICNTTRVINAGNWKTRLKWFGHCLRREPITKPHLCKIAKTRSFWEKEQRSTEKEMEGQRKGRHEEIPTD